jgi:vacuolar-type H+-ATPase subunit D/Vma8
MKYFLTAVLVASGLAAASAADTLGTIETGRSLIATQRKALITEAMQLTPDQAKTFWPLYNEYQEAMRKVGDQRVAVISEYAKNYQTLTDAKASELLNKALAFESERTKLKEQFVKKFAKVLPGREVARFFQADSKIDAYINASLADEIPLVPTPAIKNLVAAQQSGAAGSAAPAGQ